MLATINGCQIHYELRRNAAPDAPCVLLLHGWGCDMTTFSFIEGGFTPTATVLLLDFPGHGQSDEPPCPWGVWEYTDQVYALLKTEGLNKVKVVAHSFGARVAIDLAARYPDMVDQLVITGGAGIKKPVSERSRKRAARFKRCNVLLDRVKHALPPLTAAMDALQTRLRNHYGSPDYIKLNENMRKTFVRVVSEDLLPRLKRIQAPTLLIWGSADTETPLWMGEVMEKEIPDAGLVVFEGGTHFAFLEQWQRFVLIAKQFFMEDHAG